MIRFSYPKEKIKRLGLEREAFCIRLSSKTDEAAKLAFKILSSLEKNCDIFLRATGIEDEIQEMKKQFPHDSFLLNENYREKKRGKHKGNQEIFISFEDPAALSGILYDWHCSPRQEKSVFITSKRALERFYVGQSLFSDSSDLLKKFWPYIFGCLECDPHAKWNTYQITVRKECRSLVEAIIKECV